MNAAVAGRARVIFWLVLGTLDVDFAKKPGAGLLGDSSIY
jgi:hypothetical protein